MLRSAQTLMANVMIRHHLGRGNVHIIDMTLLDHRNDRMATSINQRGNRVESRLSRGYALSILMIRHVIGDLYLDSSMVCRCSRNPALFRYSSHGSVWNEVF